MNRHFDLEHICRLAHLRLEPEEKAKLEPQLEAIVAWVGNLSRLTIDKKKTEVRPQLSLPLRPDEVSPSFPPKAVLEAAAESDEAFIKVPKVLEER